MISWALLTVEFRAGVYYAATGMTKHGMGNTIFLAEMSFGMFAVFDVVDLHTIVTLRGEK